MVFILSEDPVQFRVVDLRKMVVREVNKDGKSVLQTCGELNQIQTSKVQSILGKLNEVVSFLLLIELLFVQYFFVHVCVANK